MRNSVTKPLLAVATLSLLALAGCSQTDPLKRDYMWEETGVNKSNIAAMAANPADLNRGRDTAQRRVRIESDSVESLWGGKPKPLLSAGSSSGASGSSGAPATTGGGS